MTFSTRSVAVFVASAAVGTIMPVALASSLTASYLHEGASYTTSDGTQVRVRRVITAKDRLDFNKAMAVYNSYRQQGKPNLVMPDINDRKTIEIYLRVPVISTRKNTGAPDNPVSIKDYVPPPTDFVDTTALSREERIALQRSEKVGKCWHYPQFSEGFYELCLQMIKGKTPVDTSGFENDLIQTRQSGRASLSSSSVSSSKGFTTIKGYDYRSSSSSSAIGRRKTR